MFLVFEDLDKAIVCADVSTNELLPISFWAFKSKLRMLFNTVGENSTKELPLGGFESKTEERPGMTYRF